MTLGGIVVHGAMKRWARFSANEISEKPGPPAGMTDMNYFDRFFLNAVENLIGGFWNEFDEYSWPLRSHANGGVVGDEEDRVT
nr:hypothetical protein [Methylocystis rosea]